MRVFHGFDSLPQFTRPVVTVGSYDGVHLGHRALIDRLVAEARSSGGESIVLTFEPHPRITLGRAEGLLLLTTLDEKVRLLETLGVDNVIVIPFDRTFSALSGEEFVREYLLRRLGARTLVVGYDHRFGHDRDGCFDDYAAHGRRLGIEVLRLERYDAPGGEHISSSEIRRALAAGEVARANAMLGYRYALEGTVVDGFKVGRTLGFPTANLRPDYADKLVPAAGVYAVRARAEGRTYPGMLNIGTRPTLAGDGRTSIEAHLIGFGGDLYAQTLRVEFVARLRDERRFASPEALAAQLARDREEALRAAAP